MNNSLSFENLPIHKNDALEEFIHLLPFNADLKDAKTKKYIEGNAHVSRLLGLTPQAYRGLSLADWHAICKLKTSFVEKITRLEQRVYTEKLSIHHQHDLLAHNGNVVVEHTVKKPVFSPLQSNKVVAIFSWTKDITPYINPYYLFLLYQNYYPTKQAIIQFLESINLKSCFNKLPAKRELLTLLAMRDSSSSKYAAKLLGVTYRTIEEYKARLRDKLRIISLDELLMRLRNSYEEKYVSVDL